MFPQTIITRSNQSAPYLVKCDWKNSKHVWSKTLGEARTFGAHPKATLERVEETVAKGEKIALAEVNLVLSGKPKAAVAAKTAKAKAKGKAKR